MMYHMVAPLKSLHALSTTGQLLFISSAIAGGAGMVVREFESTIPIQLPLMTLLRDIHQRHAIFSTGHARCQVHTCIDNCSEKRLPDSLLWDCSFLLSIHYWEMAVFSPAVIFLVNRFHIAEDNVSLTLT